MEDFWKRARSFAEEAAKKSQSLTAPNKIADLVAETAKKSKELAAEATKKADELKTAALKQADQIQIQAISKSISDFIPPQLSSLSITSPASSCSDPPPISDLELRKFGLTDDLRDFVKGFTPSTFQDFPSPVQDEPKMSDATTTGSNVRKDLSEWQERHATLVLTTYMEEVKQRKVEAKEEKPAVKAEPESSLKTKTSSSSAEQDLDTFLLGDFESDGGGDEADGDVDADGSLDDDFDKIENSDVEDEKKNSEGTKA
ncbi:hypothetical protein F3Y22_tig00010263pilonHSYRG00154 [Hibiscus syriacus]|uniref:BSD domain-containing protein n=1 Tax=Hibiscus syriacus TaxID=106335 RepID=A0A6A3C663_HIBSY|nr:hypothetical protein F3Y22_tig00010263pilonHSYRG00154 [Hibiscus syriacus]